MIEVKNPTFSVKDYLPSFVQGKVVTGVIHFCQFLQGMLIVQALKFRSRCLQRKVEVEHNGTVGSLTALLNSTYKSEDGIYLQDVRPEGEWLMAYSDQNSTYKDMHLMVWGEDEENEERMVCVNEQMAYDAEQIVAPTTAFEVYIPMALWSKRDTIMATVDKYRLASRTAVAVQNR